MKILVLSDTHIPKAALDLPKRLYDELEDVDMIFHAGDFVERDFFERLKDLKEIRAVYGNMDSRDLHEILNPKEVIEIGKFRIGLIHGYGPPGSLIETVRGEFKNVDAIVFGHSHSPMNIVKEKILFFNPGSPTDKIFATDNSYGILEVTEKQISGKIVRL